ncbi:MAG: excinuclease ABC subunit UvrA [Selenomonadaceae bacterium]|nr:excinuclease ABC subunit UvrA [Selenomonadaceae bacterium]
MSTDYIKIVGARAHNLKNVSVEIPRGKLIVITGLSGSGKSSLAFDTIYAEGQRRYVESLSAYARQFLGLMDKPDVDLIEGLSPAISIDQKTTSHNPRSTVGTVTEIYDYLRLLFARIGKPHCPKCGRPIQSQSVDQIVEQIMRLPTGTKFSVLAPIVKEQKGEHRKLLEKLRADGFVRARVDGSIKNLDEEIKLNKKVKHSIEAVIDRLVSKDGMRSRLTDSIETALRLGDGIVYILIQDDERLMLFSEKFACVECGISLPDITPRLFSFNNPTGACPDCNGLGRRMTFDPSQIHGMFEWMYAMYKFKTEEEGSEVCPTCRGARLKPEALAVTVGGKNIFDVTLMTIRQCQAFFDVLELTDKERQIAAQVIKEIRARLKFLLDVGLDYLTLSRSAGTLAGGEAQRIRLATQIGSGLTGVLYILDEPSIGLHQRDNQKLLATLKRLRDLGNTLIVVEHDEETMLAADQIIDIGIGAGEHGGRIVAQGTAREIMAVEESITGQYLSGRRSIAMPTVRRTGNGHFIEVIGAAEHNLKSIDVRIPLGTLTLVTGVSGSGKSTLVNEILYKALAVELNQSKATAGRHERIVGREHIDKVINIDQQPIGRTPRSNPATYTGVFDLIRQLFASTKTSKTRGYNVGRFSFNVKGGRCESCKGAGILEIEMNFLPNVYVECEVCHGMRYNRETLEVRYKEKNIADVLSLTVDEAIEFFGNVPRLARRLQIISDVGLGYIKLGQPATTLSGGEAQRVKLATELSRQSTGRTLYILDEPTTGLHAADIDRLLKILQRLVDGGNTVVVIEHNLDVIKCADWIIDLGPEGGDLGGNVVAVGTPEQLSTVDQSYTGQFLKRYNREQPPTPLT